MDGFKNIDIKNFRGIESLKMEDFSRVNVLTGQNSSGKSSVLECLMLMVGMANPDLPQMMNSLRARGFTNFSDLSYIFRNGDFKQRPQISSKLQDETNRHLMMEMVYTFDDKSQGDFQNGQIPTSETKSFINTLRMLFKVETEAETKHYECGITYGSNGIDRKSVV